MSERKLESRIDIAFYFMLACSFYALQWFEDEWLGRLNSNLFALLLVSLYTLFKWVVGALRILQGKCVNKYKGGVGWCYVGNMFLIFILIFVSFRFTAPAIQDALAFYSDDSLPEQRTIVVDSVNSYFGTRFLFQSLDLKDDSETYFMFQRTPVIKTNLEYTAVIAPRSGLVLELRRSR